jgi:alpha-ketoglutarate-dependent taurine dioxygenase
MTIEIRPSGAALGAEILGVHLTRPRSDDEFATVRDAFYKHEVVYFRGRELSDEDHIRFSARFGELRKLELTDNKVPEHRPEIFVISNIERGGQYIGSYDAGVFWHTDGAYLANPHAVSGPGGRTSERAAAFWHHVGRVLSANSGRTRYFQYAATYEQVRLPSVRLGRPREAVRAINGDR